MDHFFSLVNNRERFRSYEVMAERRDGVTTRRGATQNEGEESLREDVLGQLATALKALAESNKAGPVIMKEPDVPQFDGDKKNYPTYLTKVSRWLFLTKIPDADKAMQLANGFLDGTTPASVAAAMSTAQLRKTDAVGGLEVGLDIEQVPEEVRDLIKRVNEAGYRGEKFELEIEALTRYESLSRQPGQEMKEYAAQYAAAVAELDRLEIGMPSRVHAFKLMLTAGIPQDARPAVMADVKRGEVTLQSMTTTLNFMFDSLAADEGQQVFAVGKGGKRTKAPYCFNCGDAGHMGRDCRFREPVCHRCKKPGHKSFECKESNERQGSYPRVVFGAWVGANLPRQAKGEAIAVVDTGASETVVGSKTFERLDGERSVRRRCKDLFMFGVDGRVPEFVATVTVEVEGVVADLDMHVFRDAGDDALPLLFSRKAVERVNMVIDAAARRGTIRGKPMEFLTIGDGHLGIRVRRVGEIAAVCGSRRRKPDKVTGDAPRDPEGPTCVTPVNEDQRRPE